MYTDGIRRPFRPANPAANADADTLAHLLLNTELYHRRRDHVSRGTAALETRPHFRYPGSLQSMRTANAISSIDEETIRGVQEDDAACVMTQSEGTATTADMGPDHIRRFSERDAATERAAGRAAVMTAENAEYLSGRPSTISANTPWPLPGRCAHDEREGDGRPRRQPVTRR